MENLFNEDAKENTPEVKAEDVISAPETKEEPAAPVAEEAPAKAEEAKSVPTNNDVIGVPSYDKPRTQEAVGPLSTGALGTVTKTQAPKKAAPAKREKNAETVAINSTKNVSWMGIGKVVKGINFVSPADAEQWLTRDHVTKLTPEQVAKEYGL